MTIKCPKCGLTANGAAGNCPFCGVAMRPVDQTAPPSKYENGHQEPHRADECLETDPVSADCDSLVSPGGSDSMPSPGDTDFDSPSSPGDTGSDSMSSPYGTGSDSIPTSDGTGSDASSMPPEGMEWQRDSASAQEPHPQMACDPGSCPQRKQSLPPSVLSILALIFSFLCNCVGLILAIVDLGIHDRKHSHSLAKDALIISIIHLVLIAGLSILMGFPADLSESGDWEEDWEEDWDGPSEYGPFTQVELPLQELVSQDGISITATAFFADGSWGPEITLSVENATGRDIYVQAEDSSVNGYMNYADFYADVEDGAVSTSTLDLNGYGLNICGIRTVSQVETSFSAYDAEDGRLLFQSGPVSILTDAGEDSLPPLPERQVIFEENGVTVSVLPIPETSDLMPEDGPLLLVENHRDTAVTVYGVHAMVDGTSVSPSFYVDVLPGKQAAEQLFFYEYLEKENRLETAFDVFDRETGERVLETDLLELYAPPENGLSETFLPPENGLAGA